MRKISEHLGHVIVVLAGIMLITAAIATFQAPISNFFKNIVEKESGIGETITADIEDIDISSVSLSSSGKVRLIAHRGYAAVAPENTESAFRLARKKGFRYVETDVKFTKDGVAVLIHDASVDRTSNGTGNIADLTLAEVKALDFGSWKGSEYAGEQILTFEEFIILCKNLGLHPYIEMGGNCWNEGRVAGLISTIEDCGMTGKVTFLSQKTLMLGWVVNQDPNARLCYCISTAVTEDVINTVKGWQTGTNTVVLDVDKTKITEEGAALCKANGIPLGIWTVDNMSIIDSMPDYVSEVTTNAILPGDLVPSGGGSSGGSGGSSSDAFRLIALKGYSSVAPQNTESAIRLAKEKGFKYVKVEVAISSDDVPVLLAKTTGGTTVDAGNLTLAELKALDCGSWKSEDYAGEQILTFEEFIALCKELNLYPYIEFQGNKWNKTKVSNLMTTVNNAGMKDKVTYHSQKTYFADWVVEIDPTANLYYSSGATFESTLIDTVKGWRTGSNNVTFAISKNELTDETIELCEANNIPLSVWTVNDMPYINSMSDYITIVETTTLLPADVLAVVENR